MSVADISTKKDEAKYEDGLSIWRISPDGSNDTLVANYASTGLIAYGNYLYFPNAQDDNRIYR